MRGSTRVRSRLALRALAARAKAEWRSVSRASRSASAVCAGRLPAAAAPPPGGRDVSCIDRDWRVTPGQGAIVSPCAGGSGLALGRLLRGLELCLHPVALVWILETLLEDRDGLRRPPGEAQRVPEVEERVLVVDVVRARREGVDRPLEDRH